MVEKLWMLKLPLNIKIFIRRACYDWIPTLESLAQRNIVVDDKCPICKRASETTLYALRDCKIFRYAHFDWLHRTVVGGRLFSNFFDLIRDCLTRMSTNELELFCVSSWRIWCSRNSIIHDNVHRCNLDVGCWSRNYITQLQTMAIYRGFIFSRDCGLTLCILESDAETVVKRITDGCSMDANSVAILASIASLLDRSVVNNIPKKANRATFGLAKNAMSINEDLYWLKDFPGCIRSLVEAKKLI
ncbi:hypothetical protein Dsin_028808 [Dipteronia sinensis]|uniref:Reverse transcriptase zinc-binding domain-containing protein n=1 Tax=Dipteronia sinensis TaxID=43782 RepID=A0AAD9ZSK0_9ROSI|nr:hypothetical protein Dsin_028808 [Dipteronia sinensis]